MYEFDALTVKLEFNFIKHPIYNNVDIYSTAQLWDSEERFDLRSLCDIIDW